MTKTPILEAGEGFSLVLVGERYWLDIDRKTGRVRIDLQHHGLMGQPGEVERVGEGVWLEDRITARSGSLSPSGFDAAEKALRGHLEEARKLQN